MDHNQLKTLDTTYIAGTYKRCDVVLEAGNGATVGGDRQYVDFSSGIGVNSFGFAYDKWLKAVTDQAGKIGHASNYYYTAPMARLAQALCQRTGMKKAFFGNSGAEANEGMIKTARKYGADHYGPERHEIITLVNSFHGRTIATLAATGQEVFHKNFGPFPAGFVYAEANNIDDLMSRVSDKTCAIMIECIQGEGGVVPLEPDFVQAIAEACKERDILLAVDEIQSGVGRTGKFLCCEHYGVQPDLVSLAKGLGGGLPIGAVLFGEKTQDTLGIGDHGTTFGGNPVVCAGGLAVMESIDEALLAQVTEKGSYLVESIAAMPGVKSVTGKGLMLGVELTEGLAAADIVAACAKEGLIILTAKHKLRLLPPLNITRRELDQGLGILKSCLEAAVNK